MSLHPSIKGRSTELSKCRKYRYHLCQIWDESKPPLLWLLLNPSVADESRNDRTLSRCEGFAKRLGYGGLEIYNLFAFRSTDRTNMRSQKDPVGPDNDIWVKDFARKTKTTTGIVGWGTDGAHENRGRVVMNIIKNEGGRVHALRVLKSGHPSHPLYLPYDLEPILYRGDF